MAYDFNPFTGTFDDKGKTLATLDLRYLKLSGSLAEVSNHSHTVLTDIGTNTHAQIDTFIGTTVPATYLPLAGGTMTGGITNSTSINPLTTLAESWIGPSTTTGIYFKGGNVGINETSPGYKLHITDNTSPPLCIEMTTTTSDRAIFDIWRDANITNLESRFRYIQLDSNNSADEFAAIAFLATDTTASSKDGQIRFRAQSNNTLTNTLVIDGANVGIGTTTPTSKLQVLDGAIENRFNPDVYNGFIVRAYGSTDALSGADYVTTRTRNAAHGSHTILVSGDAIGRFRFLGSDGVGYREAAEIRVEVDTTPGTNDMPGRLTFWTTPDTSTTPVEAMRIDSSQHVGIGVTPTAVLHLKASTASANTSSFKMNAGTLLTTPESGVIEFDGTDWYLTI